MAREWGRLLRGACLVVPLSVSLLAASLMPASADRYRQRGPGASYVVAESHWGNGTIAAPVRRGPVTLQVRLPGGNWIDCQRSCSETLRRATVDFWPSQGNNEAIDSGPGYFRWEFRY